MSGYTKASVRILAVVLTILAVAACATPKNEGRISAVELRALVPGATLKGMVTNGDPFEGAFFRNGTMAIRTHGDADTGTWEFEDDTVCLTWEKWREGKRYCIYWQRNADGYASYFLDGRLSTRLTIVD